MQGLDATERGELLERVYADCHRLELIDPDPLLVVRSYTEKADQELVGFFCASLALGRARSIVDSCLRALAPFGHRPSSTIEALGPEMTAKALGLDVYRFFSREDMGSLLSALAGLQHRFGSLEALFLSATASSSHLDRCDAFVDAILKESRNILSRNLVSAPRDGSACKRLMLFMRWMVRSDSIDLGLWTNVSPRDLLIPLDTHVHRIARALGLCTRTIPDLKAVLETTESLRLYDNSDPTRFDFALARLGIRSDYSLKDYFIT
ncbi:TIGR02757 family protein [Treponema sp.]